MKILIQDRNTPGLVLTLKGQVIPGPNGGPPNWGVNVTIQLDGVDKLNVVVLASELTAAVKALT